MNQLELHQHQLETILGITNEERMWIMANAKIPPVRQFWTAYKRALNFIHDTDRINIAKKHLAFIRSVRRSGFSL